MSATLSLLALAAAGLAGASDCRALAERPELRGTVSAATLAAGTFEVAAAGPRAAQTLHLPPFCRVSGTLRPGSDSAIHFEVWLPAIGWNQRLVQVGNSGLAGAIPRVELAHALAAGYAAAGTDDGHTGTPTDSLWAYGHPGKLRDYGERAVHLTARAAHSIAHAYYARSPRFRYFVGCSDGGRESLMEAQRHPEDFDGYVAGSPGIDIPTGSILLVHAARTLEALPPAERITLAQIETLSAGALARCDALDGVQDGVLRDPRSCPFDVRELLCGRSSATSCLTAAQVAAIESLQAGPKDRRTGRALSPGLRDTLGAERALWAGPLIDPAGGPPPVGRVAAGYLSGVLYGIDQPKLDTLDLANISRDADALYRPAIDPRPELGAARRLGRKIIHYQGWSDPINPPQFSLDYYQAIHARFGARSARFYRLFMVPGMGHCGGGIGPTEVGSTRGVADGPASTRGDSQRDWLEAIEAWVERGVAPDRIIASQYGPAPRNSGVVLDAPVIGTRPLCPYPQIAVYRGTGKTTEATNFECHRGGA